MKRNITLFAIFAIILATLALHFTGYPTIAKNVFIGSIILGLIGKYYHSGIKANRFFYRLEEGTVVAIATGQNGVVSHYVVPPKTWERIWEELCRAFDYFKDRDAAVKRPALAEIRRLQDFLNENVKPASGILSQFNWYTLSWWNRAVTLKTTDSGETTDKVTHFPFIRSVTRKFDGVEISATKGEGTVPITVTFQVASFLFLDFSRIFNEPEPSEAQINAQVRSALVLYLSGTDPEKLEQRRFSEDQEAAAMLHLLQFGMIGRTLGIPDYSLEENQEVAEVKRQQFLVAERRKIAVTEAEIARIKAEGEARAVQTLATAAAAAFKKKAQALKGVDPDVARALISPKHSVFPGGARIYGAGNGIEVWADEGKEEKPKKN